MFVVREVQLSHSERTALAYPIRKLGKDRAELLIAEESEKSRFQLEQVILTMLNRSRSGDAGMKDVVILILTSKTVEFFRAREQKRVKDKQEISLRQTVFFYWGEISKSAIDTRNTWS